MLYGVETRTQYISRRNKQKALKCGATAGWTNFVLLDCITDMVVLNGMKEEKSLLT